MLAGAIFAWTGSIFHISGEGRRLFALSRRNTRREALLPAFIDLASPYLEGGEIASFKFLACG